MKSFWWWLAARSFELSMLAFIVSSVMMLFHYATPGVIASGMGVSMFLLFGTFILVAILKRDES